MDKKISSTPDIIIPLHLKYCKTAPMLLKAMTSITKLYIVQIFSLIDKIFVLSNIFNNWNKLTKPLEWRNLNIKIKELSRNH